MNEQEEIRQGEKLLTAVERILEDTDEITRRVAEMRRETEVNLSSEEDVRAVVAKRIVERYSRSSAVSGGAAALPALFPGIGTLAALTGGTLADMGFVLKFEVEMAMSLTALHGWDITEPGERQFAFLLASVNTYDAKSGRNFFVDVAAAEGTALWNYGPREVGKLLVSVMTKLALLSLSKGFVRALPLVGIAVGAGMNKVLTQKVGQRVSAELERRRKLQGPPGSPIAAEVVDAKVRKEAPGEATKPDAAEATASKDDDRSDAAEATP